MRRALVGGLLLLLAAAAGGGAYVYKLWYASDEMLRQLALDKFHELAPEWHVAIKAARFDFEGRAHLTEVQLFEADGHAPLLDVSEVIFTVDRDRLTEPDPPLRKVELIHPTVKLQRLADGTWNWQRLPALNLPPSAIPEFTCERVEAIVKVAAGEGAEPVSLRVEEGTLKLVPSGKRQFLVKGRTRWERTDDLSFEGNWNIDTKALALTGSLRNLRIDSDFLRLLAQFSPELRRGLAQLPQETARLPASAGGKPVDAGLSAIADVTIQVARLPGDPNFQYSGSLSCLSGDWRAPPVPYPLHNLRGRLDYDGASIALHEVSAHSGSTRIAIEQGEIALADDAPRAEFKLVLDDMPFDKRLFDLLPPSLRQVHTAVGAKGLFDARLRLARDGHGAWTHDGEVHIKSGSACYEKFPYPIEQIQGWIRRKTDLVEMELVGLAGSRPVTLKGGVLDPGPEAALLVDIATTGLPIDRKFYTACPPKFRKVIDQLSLRGQIDGHVWLRREAGRDRPLEVSIEDGKLRDGIVRCLEFPYGLTDVSADFAGGGDTWEIESFRGRRGAAEFACDATWGVNPQKPQTARDQLWMKFRARQVPLDPTLREALPAPWQETWAEFNPQGLLDVSTGNLTWKPGAPPELEFDAELSGGRLHLQSFPIPLENVQAELFFAKNLVKIKSFGAQFDEARVAATGYAQTADNGEWRVHFDQFRVDDAEATRALRRALPRGMLEVIEACNLRGKVSILGGLEFRGRKGSDYGVTAAWDTTTIYSGNTITAGVELKQLHGRADFHGTWDGERVDGDGQINLDSVNIFGFQFEKVQGPVSIHGNQLLIGDPQLPDQGPRKVIDQARRLRASFVDGRIGLDADIDLQTNQYRTLITLSDGQLKKYAQLYMPASRDLAGVTNGWVELEGVGADPKRLEGRGQLLVQPAALYELPVILAVFNALTLAPANNAAFDRANFQFVVNNATVRFERINLVGDAVSLVGRGDVKFDGGVNLDFFSAGGRRNPVDAIPFVNTVFRMGTTGWVRVTVGGKVTRPESRVVPLPQLDEGLRRLLGIFDHPRTPARR